MGWFFAIISGTFAAFSYPSVFEGNIYPSWGGVAFFCWVPLLLWVSKVSPRRAFCFGFVASFFHYSISMYWLYTAMHGFGGLSPIQSILSLAVLITVLSGYFGIIFGLSQWAGKRIKVPANYIRPFIWLSLEYVRTHIPLGGLPWGQVAYSQGGFLSVIQMADVFGVYGVTLFIVLTNEALASLFLRWNRLKTPRNPVPSYYFVVMVVALWVAALVYGSYRLSEPYSELQEIKTGIVQGNIPQDEKWSRGKALSILNRYTAGSLNLSKQGAELILWPEAAYPWTISLDQKKVPFPKIDLGKSQLLLGGLTRSIKNSSSSEMYNSALLMDAEGFLKGFYHKKHLVPFGEYVPWKNILFFAKKLTQAVGDISPGESYYPLKYQNSLLGILICYEDIFPEIARKMVQQGAHALINLTNDAWYGYSSAAFQHQVFSQFRSVETRRATIRATNTGVSSLIDPKGHIKWQGKIFEQELFLTSLPLYEGRSFYVRWGDWLPYLCIVFSFGIIILALRKKET